MGNITDFLAFYGDGQEMFAEFLLHVDKEIRECQVTALCDIMRQYGSDKGSGRHNYTILYHHLFQSMLGEVRNVFELGVGTNFLEVQEIMVLRGVRGASLRGWREFFSSSTVYGADIDRRVLFQDERIATLYVDQKDPASIISLWDHTPVSFDLMIDDGLHEFEANSTFLAYSKSKLLDSGIYIIEDIVNASEILIKYDKFLDGCGLSGFMYRLPNKQNGHDNTVAVLCGPAALKPYYSPR
jgi:hypothetical protein